MKPSTSLQHDRRLADLDHQRRACSRVAPPSTAPGPARRRHQIRGLIGWTTRQRRGGQRLGEGEGTRASSSWQGSRGVGQAVELGEDRPLGGKVLGRALLDIGSPSALGQAATGVRRPATAAGSWPRSRSWRARSASSHRHSRARPPRARCRIVERHGVAGPRELMAQARPIQPAADDGDPAAHVALVRRAGAIVATTRSAQSL